MPLPEPLRLLDASIPADLRRTCQGASNHFFGYRLAVGDRAPSDGTLDLFVGAARDRGTIYLFSGSSTGLPVTATVAFTGASVPDGDLGPSSLSSAPP